MVYGPRGDNRLDQNQTARALYKSSLPRGYDLAHFIKKWLPIHSSELVDGQLKAKVAAREVPKIALEHGLNSGPVTSISSDKRGTRFPVVDTEAGSFSKDVEGQSNEVQVLHRRFDEEGQIVHVNR